MLGTVRSAINGRLSANFFVDKWPDYSAVVGELIWPRRSDVADIAAYATSSESVLSVLTEGNLVTWGKRQEFQRIEESHADFLLKNMKPPARYFSDDDVLECVHKRISLYFPNSLLPGSELLSLVKTSTPCPNGFILGRLKPHHAQLVASQWPRLNDWPNKLLYFKELISSYYNIAIFQAGNLYKPVTYIIQLPCGQGFAYTAESYRGKGLTVITRQKFVANAIIDGYLPREEEVGLGVKPWKSYTLSKEFIPKPSGIVVKDLILKQSGSNTGM